MVTNSKLEVAVDDDDIGQSLVLVCIYVHYKALSKLYIKELTRATKVTQELRRKSI
jgi:hypothetical protein